MKTWWQKEETRADQTEELIITDNEKEAKDFHYLNKNTNNEILCPGIMKHLIRGFSSTVIP